MRKPIPLWTLDTRLLDQYKNSYKQVKLWHGTGRLQYQGDEIIDVLQNIIDHAGLKPHEEPFDYKHGTMMSISTAKQRMYSRLYADMHQEGGPDPHSRYGKTRLLVNYFGMATMLAAIKENKLWSRKERLKATAETRQKSRDVWGTKIHKSPPLSWTQFFTQGSDIAGNYALLLAISRQDYDSHSTSEAIGIYEQRVSQPISIADITHIEVPGAKLQETKELLKDSSVTHISVFPIELGEYFASQSYFSTLVSVHRGRS